MVISLEEIKTHLRINHSEEDIYLTSLLEAAIEYCENFTGRVIKQKIVEIILDTFPARILKLPITPVIDVTSINYTNSKEEEIYIEALNYVKVLETEPPLVVHKESWPQDVINIPGKVRVAVNAGYEIAPQSIKQAVLLLCGHFYENREAVSIKGELKELPFSVSALLYPYKVFRW